MTFLENLHATVYCRLGVSRIDGVGVFAIKDIPAGINPMQEKKPQFFERVKGGDMRAAFKTMAIELASLVRAMCVEDKEDDVWYCPAQGLNGIGIAWYLNHSKEPNMTYNEKDANFYSLRDIKAGEELTVDYGTYGALNL